MATTPTTTCTKCNGCGKLDSREQRPWSRFRGTPNPDINTGKITPLLCPDCKGTGIVKGTPPPVQPVVTETHRDAGGNIQGVVLADGTRVGTFPPPAAPASPAAPETTQPAAS